MSEEKKRNNLDRTVHLGLYGDAGQKLLVALKSMVQKCGSRLDAASMRRVEVVRAPDGELCFEVFDDDHWDAPLRKTVFARASDGKKPKDDASVRKWLAGVVKGAAKMRLGYCGYNMHQAEIEANEDWRRDRDLVIRIAPGYEAETADNVFTVSQAYAAYESLKGRKPSKDRFCPGAVDQVVGEPFDPVRTELETFRREEMKRIDAELKAEEAEISKWYSSEYTKIEQIRSERCKAAEEKAKAEKARVNSEIAESLHLAA